MHKDKKIKILVVEDEPALIGVLDDKLTREGFSVIRAMDGEVGLKMVSDEKPDLILLDIIMPKMDGITMLKKLRESEDGKNIPVIILTNLSDSEKNTEMTEKGVLDFLIKTNWKLDDVVKKIKQRLNLE